MTHFVDRVRNSEALSNLKEANELLKELADRDWQHHTTVDVISRLTTVAKHIIRRLTIVDRNLVPFRTLEELDGQSSEFLGLIEGLAEWEDDDEPDDDAAKWADELLVEASMLPALAIRTTPEVLQRVTEQFDSDVHAKTTLFTEKYDETQSSVNALGEKVGNLSEHCDELVTQFECKVSERVDRMMATSEELLQKTGDAAQRLEQEVTDIQATFRRSQREREDEFARAETLRTDAYNAEVDPIVSQVGDLRDQANSMLEEVAGASTAEHYAKLRIEQNKAANFWRWTGVIALVVLVGASVGVFFETRLATEDFSILSIFGRSGLLISLSALATYSLRQSGHHRQREEDIARVRNELMLLWPFMNRLPEEDRRALLLEITPSYFKGGLSAHDAGDQVGLGDQFANFVKRRKRDSPDG